jgi:hypothetical protein
MSWNSWLASLRARAFGPTRARSGRPRRRPSPLGPRLEALEERLTPAVTVSFNNGTVGLAVAANDNVSATLTATSSTTAQIALTGDTFALDGKTASSTFFSLDLSSQTLSITTTSLTGSIAITEFDPTLAGGNSFTLSVVNGALMPSNVKISTSGSGSNQVTLNSIALNGTLTVTGNTSITAFPAVTGSTAKISTQGHDISLTGQGNASSSAGVLVGGAILNAGGGNITLTGTGAAGGFASYGVMVETNGSVQTSGPGSITIKGTAGNSSTNGNVGVYIGGPGSAVTSADGNIAITGLGAGTGSVNPGIEVQAGGVIQATGAGAVSLTGTGGASTGSTNIGVYITGGGTTVTAQGGGVSLTGTGGGSGTQENGVEVQTGATVSATGTVTIKGNASPGGNGSGLLVQGGTVSTPNGAITITGNGGGVGSGNNGVSVQSGTIQATAAGTVAITGNGGVGATGSNDGVLVSSGTVSALSGGLTITGTGNGTGTQNYGVDLEGGVQVSAGQTGNVTIKGTGSASGTDSNVGVRLAGSGTQITTPQSGAITITGSGGGSGQGNYGIDMESSTEVEAEQGAVGLTGTGGNGTGGNNDGVYVTGATVSGGAGGVSITGTGNGSGNLEYGVDLEGGAQVLVLGSVNGSVAAARTGNVTIKGTGSALGTDDNAGVRLNGKSALGVSTQVQTESGALAITGTGGGTTDNNFGIDLENANVDAEEGGPVSLTGTGGNGQEDSNEGVYIAGGTVSGQAGGVSITGTGNGSGTNERGVDIEGVQSSGVGHASGLPATQSATVSTTGTGPITIKGTGSLLGTSGNTGVFISGNGAQVNVQNGALSITGIGGGTTSGNNGVDVEASAVIQTVGSPTGRGAISITGTGGNGTGSNNVGVYFTGGQVKADAGGVAITGTGNGSLTGEFGVDLESSTTVSVTGSGAATIKGTGSTLGTDNNAGVRMAGSGTQVQTQIGPLGVTGTGGGTGGANYGIDLEPGAKISSNAGVVTLTGTGGNGQEKNIDSNPAGDNNIGNIGVFIDGGQVSAGSGGVTIAGTGAGSGDTARGVVITSSTALAGGTVSATQNGAVTIKGTGSPLGGDDCAGVFLSGTGAQVTTQSGALGITGTGGGTGDDNYGVDLRGEIQSSQGPISLTGTGGNGDADSAGVYLSGGQILAGGGGATLTGTAIGTGNNEYGVDLQDASTVSASQNGSITMKGTGSVLGFDYAVGVYVNVTGTAPQVTTQTGAISLTGTGGGTDSWNYGIYVVGGIESLQGGAISLAGTAGNGGLFGTPSSGQCNEGVLISGGEVETGAGGVSITGTGNGQGSIARGVEINGGSTVSAMLNGDGPNTIKGTGSALGMDNNTGVYINGGGTQVLTGRGALAITGTGGGTGKQNDGVDVTGGAQVQSANGGAVTLGGTGGPGSSANDGVQVSGSYTSPAGTTTASAVSTTVGNLTLNGTGGNGTGDGNAGVVVTSSGQVRSQRGALAMSGTGSGLGNSDDGVDIEGGALVSVVQDGTITIKGTGGAGVGSNVGVQISDLGSASATTLTQVSTADGLLSITGTGGNGTGNNNDGVLANSTTAPVKLSTTTGGVSISGTGGGLGSFSDGVDVVGGVAVSATVDGAIGITGTGSNGAANANNNIGVFISQIPSSGKFINSPGPQVTTQSGGITIKGTGGDFPGGTGQNNYGVDIQANAQVLAQPVSLATPPPLPAISISGTGGGGIGSGPSNIGVFLLGGGVLVKTPGTLTIAGAGGLGTGANNVKISATGVQLSPLPANVTVLPLQAPTVTTGAPTSNPSPFNDQPDYARATVTDVNGTTYTVTDGNIAAGTILEGTAPTFDYVRLNADSTQTDLGPNAPRAVGNYSVTASFSGSLDYKPATGNTVNFSIGKAAPTITFTNLGGPYADAPVPATGLVNGVDTTPGPSLEGVSLATPTNPLVYYKGTYASVAAAVASGAPLPGAPTAVNNYTVVANFLGSADYSAASAFATFSINAIAPTIHITLPPTITASSQSPDAAFPGDFFVSGAGADGTNITNTLEGKSLTLQYYVVSNGVQTPIQGAFGQNSHIPGTYAVVATFPGSSDYLATSTPSSGPTEATFTIVPGPATSFSVSGPTAPVTAGTPLVLTVTPKDQFGNTTTFSGFVSVNSNDPLMPTLSASTTVAAINGNTVSLSLDTANVGKTPTTVTVNSPATTNPTLNPPTVTGSATVTVSPAAATHFVAVNPSPIPNPISDGPLNLTIAAEDRFGNQDTSYSKAVQITDQLGTGGAVTVGSGTFALGSLNLGTGAGVNLKTLGAQTVTVSEVVAGGATPQVPALPIALNLALGPLSQFGVTVKAVSSSASAGSAFTVTVTAQSPGGNALATFPTSTLTLTDTVNGTTTTLPTPATGSITISGGVATFTLTTLTTAGSNTLTVSTNAGAVQGTSSAFTVNALTTATKLGVALTPPATSVTVNTPFSLTLTAEDTFGNKVNGFNSSTATNNLKLTTTLTGTTTPVNLTFTPTTNSFSTGVAILNGVTLTASGNQTLTATVGSGSSALQGTLNLTDPPAVPGLLDVSASPFLSVSTPSTVSAGTPFAATVIAWDGSGNVLTGFTGPITLTSTDPLAPSLGTFTFTAADQGVLVIGGLVLPSAGNQTLTVSSGSLTGAGALTVTSTKTAQPPAQEVALAPDGSLWQGSASSGWQMLSPAGTILAVSATTDAAGNEVAYAITSDHHLWQHGPGGWAILSGGAFQQVRSGANVSGGTVAFAVLADNSLWEHSPLFPGNPWRMLSPAGTILSVSAGTDNRGLADVYAVAADNSLWLNDQEAWSMLSGAGTVQSVSAVGQTVYAVGSDASLKQFGRGGEGTLSPAGTILSVHAGLDSSGNEASFVLAADHSLWEYTAARGWWSLSPAGTILSLGDGQGSDAFVIAADNALWEYSTSGWARPPLQ